jgi:hypothetical protein
MKTSIKVILTVLAFNFGNLHANSEEPREEVIVKIMDDYVKKVDGLEIDWPKSVAETARVARTQGGTEGFFLSFVVRGTQSAISTPLDLLKHGFTHHEAINSISKDADYEFTWPSGASQPDGSWSVTVSVRPRPALVLAEPRWETDLSKISEPPIDALTGKTHQGVQIGLWTEKSIYVGTEIRNVWRLVRNDRSSDITIGVGGSLYRNSFVYVTSNGEEIAKLPLNGGIDGIVNPTHIAGGLSQQLAMLPSGAYQLIWKTETHESNSITIEIKAGEQLHAP